MEDDEIKFIRMLTEVEDYNIHLTNLIKLAEAKGLDHQTEIELTRTFEQITNLARRAGEAAAKQGGGSLSAVKEEKYASIVEGRAERLTESNSQPVLVNRAQPASPRSADVKPDIGSPNRWAGSKQDLGGGTGFKEGSATSAMSDNSTGRGTGTVGATLTGDTATNTGAAAEPNRASTFGPSSEVAVRSPEPAAKVQPSRRSDNEMPAPEPTLHLGHPKRIGGTTVMRGMYMAMLDDHPGLTAVDHHDGTSGSLDMAI